MGDALRGEVARLGGDEFVVLLPELADNAEDAAALALTVAEKLRGALTTPLQVGAQQFNTGASLGITVFPKGKEGVDDLMREADLAICATSWNRPCARAAASSPAWIRQARACASPSTSARASSASPISCSGCAIS